MSNNVDDILIRGNEPIIPNDKYENNESKDDNEKVKSEVQKEIDPKRDAMHDEEDRNPSPKDIVKPKEEKVAEPETSNDDDDSNDDSDEYGNELPKAKTYTEEEVQRMIRDRLSRGNRQDQTPTQQQQQQAQKAAADFQFDENSELGWQEQLSQFIDSRLDAQFESREARREAIQQEAKQRAIDEEYEGKMLHGMSKYQDWVPIMQKMPITDAMVDASKAMKDPAAFFYAAAKQHPAELDRISKLPNKIMQATEIGRLEEKMRKTKAATRSARPLQSDKGDVMDKADPRSTRDIDNLIERHAKTKVR